MRRIGALFLSLGIASSISTDVTAQSATFEHTLEDARLLAGPIAAGLPIVLSSTPVEGASPGVEGWTVYDGNQTALRIVVYTGSEAFRCANDRGHLDHYQCRLKLASIVVHEAWHFRNGRDEAGAYETQIAFLHHKGGSPPVIWSVRYARDRVVAREQQLRSARDGVWNREPRAR